jgi:hypothetical protein
MPEPAGVLCDEVKKPPSSCPVNNYHDPLVSFVANSGLIFQGTVTALHDQTPGINVPDTTRTVVVKVDAVLQNAGDLVMAGQSVTVLLLAAPTMAVGYQGYFFTQLWTAGMSIGVTEVAHVDPGVYPTIESDVPGIEKLLADERLYARMSTATAVVVGTVSKVTMLPQNPKSEHDPLWAEATITADCALRGDELATAKAAFATSQDVAWFNSPKLQEGQKGIFLLQPSPSPPVFFSPPADIPYVLTSPLDVRSQDERDHIATLVLCPPSH